MPKPRRPEPEVMETDYRVPAAVGSMAWLVALLVLLLMGDRLAPEDQWWIWVCVAGAALGLFGFCYVPRLKRKRAEAEQRGAVDEPSDKQPDEPSNTPG